MGQEGRAVRLAGAAGQTLPGALAGGRCCWLTATVACPPSFCTRNRLLVLANVYCPTTDCRPSPSFWAVQAGIPLLVLGNKNDLPEALSAAELISRLDLRAIADRECAAYSISCKSQSNIDVTLRWLQAHAK